MSALALPEPGTVPPEVARRAVEWLVELQAGPVTEALRCEWSSWRAADPLHEQAWQRIETVNGRLAGLAAPTTAALAHAALAPRRSARRRQAVQALAVLFFGGGAAWSAHRHTPWREWTADLRTGVGERRSLRLDDGTRIVLNTGSALDLRFSATERRLRLVAGEVWIDSAQDALGRPLLVESVQGEALALGTRFTVRALETGTAGPATEVRVFDGAVRVRPRDGDAASQVLQAGEQARFTARAVAPRSAVVEASAAAWTDGMLVARGMRLADFVAELGRYSVHPLSCDRAVADLRVSGTYPVADVDKVLETVAAMLSLEVQTVTRFWGHQVVRIGLAPRGG